MIKRIAVLTMFLAGLAAAQTVYTIPAGTVCPTGIEGCYYENVSSVQADGTTLWGRFIAGGYNTQFQYEAYEGQNPGYKAQYCNGTAIWTVTDNHWLMDCNAQADQTSGDGPMQIHADITAHSEVIYVKSCSRSGCRIIPKTIWVVDEGTVTLTSL